MQLNDLNRLLTDGLNYLMFYDQINYTSEKDLLDTIKEHEILERLHNSVVAAILSLDTEDIIYEKIRSASFFLKEANDAFSDSTKTKTAWKDAPLSETREAILNAIIAYQQYIVYVGLTSLFNIEEVLKLNKEDLRKKFPDSSEEEINKTIEIYKEYIDEIEEMELSEQIMDIDYNKTGKEKLVYVDDASDEDDELEQLDSDITDLEWR